MDAVAVDVAHVRHDPGGPVPHISDISLLGLVAAAQHVEIGSAYQAEVVLQVCMTSRVMSYS